MTNLTANALQDVRAEFVESDTSGEVARPPSNPEWDRLGDYLVNYPDWDASINADPFTPVGQGDRDDTYRGNEQHDIGATFLMQEHFVDSGGTPNNPLGAMLDHDYDSEYPVYELLFRREVQFGGNFGGGFRDYVYATGAQATSGTIPGDPSTGRPIALEVTHAAEKVREYIVHQPSGSIAPTVSSTSSNDTTQTVTIESADGSSSDTFDLSGTTGVSGNSGTSFSDIAAIRVDAEHEGDISVTDGSGTDILEDPILGTTSQTEADRGLPLLGSGSHSTAIGTDPEAYQFQGTTTTYGGSDLATSTSEDRVAQLDLSVEVEVDRNARQEWVRQTIDVGSRTVTVDPQTSGPFESAKQLYDMFSKRQADVVYSFPDADVTVKNAQPENVDTVDRQAGDASEIRSFSLVGNGDPAVTVGTPP